MKQFVNDAFAQDPRILQRRAEEKAQRYSHCNGSLTVSCTTAGPTSCCRTVLCVCCRALLDSVGCKAYLNVC